MPDFEPKVETNSGLDMKQTLDWYAANNDQILQRLPNPNVEEDLEYPLVDEENIDLSKPEILALINLFPKNAQERSILDTIVGKPETWFDRKSTGETQIPTTNKIDSISETAIVPGYTYYKVGEGTAWLADIWLYKMGDALAPDVKKIVLSQAFVHEFAHTITASELYRSVPLKLPDGRIVNSKEFLEEIADKLLALPPISHYASAYRDDEGKYIEKTKTKAQDENIAELVTAHLLNFSYREDDMELGLNPTADRVDIDGDIRSYLKAERS